MSRLSAVLGVPAFTALLVAQMHTAAPPRSFEDWQKALPSLTETLKAAFPGELEGAQHPIGLLRRSDVAEITGDGLPEALIYLGTGGASTSDVALMRWKESKPVVARFRDRSGRTSEMTFLEGASVMHSDTVDLLPEQHALYAFHFNRGSDGRLAHCGGEAYVWNAGTETFDYSTSLSGRLTKEKCRAVPKRLTDK